MTSAVVTSVVFMAGDASGCGFFRMMQPALALAAIGWDTDIIMSGSPSPDCDVVVGQRIANPAATAIWQRLAAEGRRLVYEVDDDIFTGLHDSPAHAYWTQPGMLSRASANLAVSTAVTVSVEPLAQVVRQHTDAPVHVLPNCLPRLVFDLPRAERGAHPVVGYASSDSHRSDVDHEAKGLRRFWARTSASSHAMGADWSRALGTPSDRSRFTPWNADMVGYWSAIDFDIGIAPLAPLAFNQSKSPLKAIELGARGIPVVASNRGPYADHVEHGVDGFLVNRDHEWATYLELLVADGDLRDRMGAAAREKARGYVLEDRIHEWADLYSSVGAT